MSDAQRRPPPWLLRAINPFVRPVLRSPLHGLLSRRLMLLTYTGRSSGREYTIPVEYFAWDDGVIAFTSRGWWRSVRDGRPVRLRLRGRDREAVGTVERGLDDKAELLASFVRRYGPGAARSLFLGLPRDRRPTREEALAAAAGVTIVRFRLVGRPSA